MNKLLLWAFVIGAVAIAAFADYVATIWAAGQNKFSGWFFALLVISPIVFITFGLITTKVGLSITSAVVNTGLVLSSISIGLVVFGEWQKITLYQYAGMLLSVLGIILMLFFTADAQK